MKITKLSKLSGLCDKFKAFALYPNRRYSYGTNCTPPVAALFLFCYARDFMLSYFDNIQADVVEAFNSTTRNLDEMFTIDNPYFAQMVSEIYLTELQ